MIKLGARPAQTEALVLETPQVLGVDPADAWNRCLLEYVVRTKVPGGGKFGKLKLKTRKPAPKSMNQAEQDIERREEARRAQGESREEQRERRRRAPHPQRPRPDRDRAIDGEGRGEIVGGAIGSAAGVGGGRAG